MRRLTIIRVIYIIYIYIPRESNVIYMQVLVKSQLIKF